MLITVKYFASLRETLTIERELLELSGEQSIRSVRSAILAKHPQLSDILDTCKTARNRNIVSLPDEAVADGDEIVLLPPMSGG